MIVRLILIWGIAVSGIARAAECGQATTQAAMNACAAARMRAADSGLNAAYGAVLHRLAPAAQTRLREAERAWVAFRDAECAFRASGSDGGSAAAMVATDCRRELTEARAKSLGGMRVCEEGDLSCPR